MAGGYIYILGSHTGTLYIGVTSNPCLRVCNIRRARWKVSLRLMAASACSTLRVRKTFAQPSLGKNNSRAGRAKRSSTSFARSIPSLKTLHRPGDGRRLQSMKRCSRDHQVRTAGRILFSGLGGRRAPNCVGNISSAGVLRLRATSAVSRDKFVRRSAQDDVFVGILKKNIPNKLALMD
jgi:hypothetical protein